MSSSDENNDDVCQSRLFAKNFESKWKKAILELVFSHITIKRTKIAAAPIKGHFHLIVPLMK